MVTNIIAAILCFIICDVRIAVAEDVKVVPFLTEKPEWLKICKRSDPKLNECLNSVFVHMFPALANGIPEIEIDRFEPLHIDRVSVSKGSGPITLAGSLFNLSVAGPSNATSTFAEINIAEGKLKSGIDLPLLDIKSQYNLKGKILVLPLVGHGICEMKLFNVQTKVSTDISFPKRYGKEFLKIEKMRVVFIVGGMKINLQNLFNGNKVLGSTVNNFLNQNALEIISELSDSIGESLGEIFTDLFNQIFSKLPTELWLPIEDEIKSDKKTTQIEDGTTQTTSKNFVLLLS